MNRIRTMVSHLLLHLKGTTPYQDDQYWHCAVNSSKLCIKTVDFAGATLLEYLEYQSEHYVRRRHQFGMQVEGREFSDISDVELDYFIRQIVTSTPAAGLRMVQGALRQHGYLVQRIRVLQSLRRVDPVTSTLRNARRIIRRSYSVFLSKRFMSINKQQSKQLCSPYFQEAVAKYNLPFTCKGRSWNGEF
ncbi:hypothetical protein QZH41_016133 [Actinostola sp. cb2023]|nr:hypothetical protein QZH41_016133 [Actinostola sp. cb2023]